MTSEGITSTMQQVTPEGSEERLPEEGEVNGRLTIKNDVVAKIAGMAAREVQGVSPASGGLMSAVSGITPGSNSGDADAKKGIKAEVGERQAAFDLSLIVDWGYNIPAVVSEVRRRISQRVSEMTGLETTEINVEVTDVNLDDLRSRVE
jgi:uncharacterized alkaline shock family protein YloU